MATVTGLRSERQAGQIIRRGLGSRAQAPEASSLRPEPLQPQASPVDTYFRPEAPPETNGLLQLAGALSAINPALMKFTEAVTGTPEDSVSRARQYIQETDPKVLREQLKTNKVPREFTDLESMRVFGEELAYRDSQEFIRRYNTDFDKTNGDVDGLWREVTADTYQTFGEDRAFMQEYTKAAEDARRRVLSADFEYKAQEEMTGRSDSMFGAWEGRVQSMVDDETPGDTIAASLFADIPKNRDFLQLHPKEQQKMILQIADRYATRGQFDIARSILQYQRQDGSYKGSLMTDRELGDKANDLMARIGREEQQASLLATAEAEREGVLTEGMELIRSGGINTIRDVEIHDKQGDVTIFTADQQRKELGLRVQKEIDAEVEYRAKTPEERAALSNKLEKETYIGNGIENAAWFKAMDGAAGQMSTNALTGEIPPTAKDAYDLYKELHTESPQYLSKYLSGKSLDFFEVARMAESSGLVGSPEDALLAAGRATLDVDQQPEAMKFQYEKIDTAVSNAGNDGLFWDTDFGNTGFAKGEIVRTAKFFARLGMDADGALEKASEVFKKTHINVAQTWLPNDKRLPTDFPDLAQQYLNELADQYGEEHQFDADDITLDRLNNGVGAWVVIFKGSRQVIDIPDAARKPTLKTFDELRTRNRTKVEEEVIKTQNNR